LLIIRVVLRTLIIYVFIAVAIRLMGKRQIGDMQPTELVVTMLISELAAISLQDLGQPIILSFIGIFILVFLEIGISVITMRSPKAKKIFSGSPVVLISGGKIDQKAMKYVRLSSQDLMQLLREQDVFDISEVYSAVLELNGNLSVQKKSEYAPITEAGGSDTLPMLVVSDGKIITSALTFLNITEDENGLGLIDSFGNTIIENTYDSLNIELTITAVKGNKKEQKIIPFQRFNFEKGIIS